MESSVLQSKSFLPSWDDIENVKKKEKKKKVSGELCSEIADWMSNQLS